MSLEELYQEVILDHYKNPRGQEPVSCPAAAVTLYNPLCGDKVDVSVAFSCDDCPNRDTCSIRLTQIGCGGHGCSISQAAASIMAEVCEGKSLEEIEEVCGYFRAMMRGEVVDDALKERMGDAVALEGVRKFSARVKCAMLAWEALERCLATVREGRSASAPSDVAMLPTRGNSERPTE